MIGYLFCSSYEVEPSENDLLDHMPIIREAAERDKDLVNSKVWAASGVFTPLKTVS